MADQKTMVYPTLPSLTGEEMILLEYAAPPASMPVFTTPMQVAEFVAVYGANSFVVGDYTFFQDVDGSLKIKVAGETVATLVVKT
jgi:hypothetical protein